MASSDASRYDLTSELGKHLDRHLVFPLLEFLQMRKVYPEGEILEAKIELLSKTNMIDFAADIYKSLHGAKEAPAEMTKRREEVISNLQELQQKDLLLKLGQIGEHLQKAKATWVTSQCIL